VTCRLLANDKPPQYAVVMEFMEFGTGKDAWRLAASGMRCKFAGLALHRPCALLCVLAFPLRAMHTIPDA